MTTPFKLIAILPLALLGAACVPANDVTTTDAELEATLDSDIDGDGTITEGGVEVNAAGG